MKTQNSVVALILLLLLPAILMAQSTFFVSSSEGNDSNSGTSASEAWQSLEKVNSFAPSPGGQIFFKRGDKWVGTLTVPASGASGSPIVYGAYGTGDKPKIYGSTEITGWTQHIGNIYKATFPASSVEQLFVDDVRQDVARYPKTGYYDITTVNNPTSFTSTQIGSSIDYTGSVVLIRTREWYISTNDVTSSSGQSITINSAPAYDLNEGEGVVLLNKLDFLTAPGEWCFDSSTNTLYLWTSDGSNPNSRTIRVSSGSSNVSIISKSYVNIENLELAESNHKAIDVSTSSYITIDNCVVKYAANYGVFGEQAPNNITVKNCIINGASNRGIYLRGASHLIEDNEVINIGMFENLSISGIGGQAGNGITVTYCGIGNCVIRYNKIANCGLNGISFFDAPNTLIEYNTIKNSCLTIHDGGAIYCFESSSGEDSDGSIIRHNIIDNVPGNLDGYTSSLLQGAGIYTDDRISNVTIENNTVTGCSLYGLYLHNNQNVTARNNTVFNVNSAYRVTSNYGATGNSITDNTFVNTISGYSSYMGMLNPNDAYMVEIDSNTYVDHHRSTPFRRTDTYSSISFETWQSVTGEDANSTFDGTVLEAGEVEELFYNDTKQTMVFDLGNSVYRDLSGQLVAGSFSLEPFTSRILINVNRAVITKINDTEASYTGAWNQNAESGNYNNDRSYCNTVGDYLELEFFGYRIAVFTKTGSTYGKYDVYIDDELVAEDIDLSVVINGGYQCKTFETTNLANTHHTLKCVVKTAGKWCIFDSFETETGGITKINDTEASYTGTWNQNAEAGNYNNDRSYSNTIGDYLELEFFGYRIAVFTKTATTYGKYDVYIDDELVAEDIDLSVVINGGYQCKTFEKTDLTNTHHTLKCVVKTAGKWCIFDYFEAETGGTITKINDTESSYTGIWNHNAEAGNYNNDRSYSNTVGDYLELEFFGYRIAVFTKTATTYGKYDVYIDDELVAEDIDLSVVKNGGYQCKTFEKTDLTNAYHTLKCVVKTAGKWCIFDYFEVEAGGLPLKSGTISNESLSSSFLENRTPDILIYPNPTRGITYLSAKNLPTEICEMSLYNLAGQPVLKQNFYSLSGTLEEMFNISHLDNGIYILRLGSGSKIYQNKIILYK